MIPLDINNATPTQYGALSERLKMLPLWVRQALYRELQESMPECSEFNNVVDIENKLVQLFIPKMTAIGNKIISQGGVLSSNDGLEFKHKLFLTAVYNNMNMLEIAHKSGWSFRFTCEVLLELLDKSMIMQIESQQIFYQILYIVDRVSLGSYLAKMNRITKKQLEMALYSKKCSDDMGGDATFEDIILNLGYITHKDLRAATAIKESINFIVDVIDPVEVQSNEILYLQSEIEAMKIKQEKMETKMDFYKKELEEIHHENIELLRELNKHAKGVPGAVFVSLT